LKLYLETTIPNFLFADEAPDKKRVTEVLFQLLRLCPHDLCISPLVEEELAAAPEPRRSRMKQALQSLPLINLPITAVAEDLADAYLEARAIHIGPDFNKRRAKTTTTTAAPTRHSALAAAPGLPRLSHRLRNWGTTPGKKSHRRTRARRATATSEIRILRTIILRSRISSVGRTAFQIRAAASWPHSTYSEPRQGVRPSAGIAVFSHARLKA